MAFGKENISEGIVSNHASNSLNISRYELRIVGT